MKRVFFESLDGSTNRWFDSDNSECYKEDTWWNGNNWISVPTGSQWSHESLYKTSKGTYILRSYSNYQDIADRYTEIHTSEAEVWLAKNGHECDSDLLDSLEA